MSVLSILLKPLVGKLIDELLEMATDKKMIAMVVDKLLDLFEDTAAKTETTIDDSICKAIRAALNIPDND